MYKACSNHTYRPVATRKPGSIEVVWGVFQNKLSENWDDEFLQCAHLCDPHLALYMVLTYAFLILSLFRARL